MNKEELEKTRFQREKEFLCFLANPDYLRWLSDEGYFDDPRFIRYLKYMLYWKEEKYRKYILYPHGLFFLDMLQNEKFRNSLRSDKFLADVKSSQYLHWQQDEIRKQHRKQLREQQGNAAGK
jgi:mediator of RNA polymerase II transcription subunit 31|tara:strand:- start:17 stop:382 length:366 start_codon:yes stop_codon:yes gene_type:complete|eukprot:g6192.t1